MGIQNSGRHAIMPDAPVGPQVYHRLRDRIVRGQLAPGARISETEIAASYRISRQPVREAFIKLAEEDLVEIRPQRGTYVRRISLPAVMSARFVREAVEADIARAVATRADPALLAELDRQIAAQRAVVDAPDADAFLALDEGFHRLLAKAAGQAAAADILESLKTQMNRVRHIAAREFPRARLIAQHEAVVAAIRAQDPGAAEAAMRTHLRQILDDLPSIARAMPEHFDPADG